jgi:hypothetical protein
VLVACGVGAASALGNGSRPAGQTITLTLPQGTQPQGTQQETTVQVPSSSVSPAQRLEAALSDPAKIGLVADANTRDKLRAELRDLDAFIAGRPTLRAYRVRMWYVSHHVRPSVAPRRLAALLWCTLWRPHACD